MRVGHARQRQESTCSLERQVAVAREMQMDCISPQACRKWRHLQNWGCAWSTHDHTLTHHNRLSVRAGCQACRCAPASPFPPGPTRLAAARSPEPCLPDLSSLLPLGRPGLGRVDGVKYPLLLFQRL